MSLLSRRRKQWDYTSQAPRCATCLHFRKPGLFLRDSLPVRSPAMCQAGDFIVTANALCNKHQPDKTKP